nr:class B sortase [uncultured Mediterraneibacter sp.]
MKKKYIVISAIIILAAAICAAIGIRQYLLQRNAGDQYEEIREEVGTGVPEEEPEPEDTPVEIPIDFAALQERNPDVYAWITVPGTSVDYPILQSETDNSYYLTHTIDGEEKPEGSIYTENYNSKDFEDPNTIIYGHNMKNGSMFRTLHDYMDRSFFDTNREVIIYTPDAIRHYQIFAAYLYDNRHILQSYDFSNPDVYQQYLNEIFSIRDMNSFIDTDTAVGVDDKIITMSTCYGTQHDVRYIVQAVLISIEK